MSESAGRILMIPKGTYSPTTTYDPLDAVKYGHNSYVCKQTSRGNLPTNTTYWQPLTDVTADENPTEDSTNLVQSGGVYSALRTINETLTSAFANNLYTNGSKNILPNDVYSQTLANVSVSVNDNGEITVSGTANDTFKLYIHSFEDFLNDFLELNKDYVFSSGIPYNETTANITLKIMQTSGGSWVFIGNGDTFKLTSTPYRIEVVWWASSGTVLSGTCKPMICLKSDYDLDPTYVPYAKTNQQLTKDTTALLDNLEVNGAVNMLPNNATTQTINGVTFTANSDGTIIANGMNTSTSAFTYEIDAVGDNFVLPAGSYKLSGCPSNGGDNTWRLQAYKIDGTTSVAIDRGNGAMFTLTEPTQLVVKIRIGGRAGSGTLTNLTFKPMIAPVSYNGDYVPYAKTNRELTEDILDLDTSVKFLQATNKLTDGYATASGSISTSLIAIGLTAQKTLWGWLQGLGTYYDNPYGLRIIVSGNQMILSSTTCQMWLDVMGIFDVTSLLDPLVEIDFTNLNSGRGYLKLTTNDLTVKMLYFSNWEKVGSIKTFTMT